MESVRPDNGIFDLFYLGAICAEVGLLSLWWVLAPVSWQLRFSAGLLTAVILFTAWAVGYAIAFPEFYALLDVYWINLRWHIRTSLLRLPLLLLAAQSPLWIAKHWFTWRIEHRTHVPTTGPREPLGLIWLLIGIAFIAICLGLARYGRDPDEPGDFAWFVCWALVTMAVTSVTILPATAAILRIRRKIPAVILVLATNSLVVAVYLAIVSPLADDILESAMESPAFILCFTFCLALPLCIVNQLGYQLRWGENGR
jgi:hypothetical protein